MPLAADKQWVKQYGQLPWWRGSQYFRKQLRPPLMSSMAIEKKYARRGKYAKQSVEALKKGETIEFGPDGKRGVWRSIGGSPIFIEVAKGESVPEAVKREIGGGVSSKGVSGKIKDFESAVKDLYAAQGVQDWEQEDYVTQLPMRSYFGNAASFQINQALRAGTPIKDGRIQDSLLKIAKGFKGHAITIPEGTQVFRAVNGKFAEQLLSLKPGDSFRDNGFVSTAGDKSMTERFGRVRMQITIGKGQKALIYKPEKEVLFQPGRTFTVKKQSTKGSVTVISVEMQ